MLKKILVIILLIGGISLIVFFIGSAYLFGAFDKGYNEKELISHYENNKEQFSELLKYFNSIVPNDKEIEIEFENNKKLFRFGVVSIDTLLKNKCPMYLKWDLNIDKDIPSEILSSIKWDGNTFSSLKSKLDEAGCIQIGSGNPVEIGFQRSGMGMYSYYFYKEDSSNDFLNQQKKRNDIHFFDKRIAWKYDGGALD